MLAGLKFHPQPFCAVTLKVLLSITGHCRRWYQCSPVAWGELHGWSNRERRGSELHWGGCLGSSSVSEPCCAGRIAAASSIMSPWGHPWGEQGRASFHPLHRKSVFLSIYPFLRSQQPVSSRRPWALPAVLLLQQLWQTLG